MGRTRSPLSSTARGPSPAEWLGIAQRHLAAAETLLAAAPAHPDEAVYFAGFALEVALKGKGAREGIAVEPVHDLEELLVRSQVLREAKAATIPPPVVARLGFSQATYWDLFKFAALNWDNELRYNVASVTPAMASDFVRAARELVDWLWKA